MAKRRYGGAKKRAYAPERQEVPAPQAPARSEKMQALMAEAEREAQEPERRRDGFVPKPKAIRRFERYANMGDHD